MQMIVMSEVLLLNSKDIEMGLEEGGGGGGFKLPTPSYRL